MSDVIDNANETADLFLGVALRNQQCRGTTAPHGIGFCLNCGHEQNDDRRWCDVDCRLDWEQEQRRRQNRRLHAGF